MLETLNPFVRHSTRQWFHDRKPYERAAFDYRCIFGLEGELTVSVASAHYTLCENTLLIIPPRTAYNLLYSQNPRECFFGVIDFELTPRNAEMGQTLPPYPIEQIPSSLPQVDIFPPFDKPVYLADGKFARKDVESIINHFLMKEELYAEFCSVLMKRILLNCIKNDPKEKSVYSPLVTKVFNYVTHYYYLPINNAKIGEELGYAPGYINALFSKETGMSVHEYLIRFRLDRAGRMLRQEDASICEIANRCGFPSPAHFTQMFRRTFGVTPRQYRKKEDPV